MCVCVCMKKSKYAKLTEKYDQRLGKTVKKYKIIIKKSHPKNICNYFVCLHWAAVDFLFICRARTDIDRLKLVRKYHNNNNFHSFLISFNKKNQNSKKYCSFMKLKKLGIDLMETGIPSPFFC